LVVVVEADSTTRAGRWEKKQLRGSEISGKKWGIIGFGHVGQLVAGLLSGFKCEIIAYDPYASKEIAVAAGATLVSLEQLLKESDIISIHVPLLDSTRGMISEDELSQMKPSAILINIARGGIVDEKALHKALKDNTIKGAALDVFEDEPPKGSPLLKLENTLFTPHIGAQTTDAQRRVGEQLVERLLDALE
jgi:D-3-phosphoglycerate dehydrogenase